MALRPIAEGLFTDGAWPRLVGGRDCVTGRIVFPFPGDHNGPFQPWPLSRTGEVWAYTVQRFRPKSPPYAGPAVFQPFIMGYVELPGETIVASRFVEVSLDDIYIGLPVELLLTPLDPNSEDGVLVHAFRPLTSASSL